MLNPFETQEAKIIAIKASAPGIKVFKFKLKTGKSLGYNPGQYFVFSLPGFGESVFVPTEVADEPFVYDIAVQKIGRVTGKFHSLEVGDTFGIRGPYGNGFDLKKIKKGNILFVAGGLGIVPIRSLISYLTKRYCQRYSSNMQLLYGAKAYEYLLFKNEFTKWKDCLKLEITLNKPYPDTAKGWRSHAGIITTLFKKVETINDGTAIVCGPPIMFKYVIPVLKQSGFADENIYLSMERRMHCAGAGTCQHCAIGPYYVCKDGPVFSYDQIKETTEYLV